jgi:hypothetical protein
MTPPILEPTPDSPPKAIPVLEGEEGEFLRIRRRNWARLIAKVWHTDPRVCPRCGKTMRVIAAISSPAQDDVIEKILKALKLWDPPWKRPRKIRGPPPPTSGSQDSGSGPPAEDWPEGIDPPHPEDDLDPPFEDG